MACESHRDAAWQAAHDAYMQMRGASCEEACEMIDALMAPSDQFLEAMEGWVADFEARSETRSPNGKRTAC